MLNRSNSDSKADASTHLIRVCKKINQRCKGHVVKAHLWV